MKKLFFSFCGIVFFSLISLKSQTKSIHAFVALCDNKYQGIVPVPASLGNGQNAYTNLYWGAAYGVKTFFKNSDSWQLVETSPNVDSLILERCVFKHAEKNVYLVVDGYNGKYIEQTTKDFLDASCSSISEDLYLDSVKIPIRAGADLIAFIGHNYLLDYYLDYNTSYKSADTTDVMIFSCYGKSRFKPILQNYAVNPIVWSTGLMAAEAYPFEWALQGWVLGENNEDIRLRAAKAYNYYQKCGLEPAKYLLVTGF